MKFSFCLSVGMCVIGVSCSTTKYQTVPYFTDLGNSPKSDVKIATYQAPKIQTDDLLYVMIQTADGTSASVMAAIPAVLSVTSTSSQSTAGNAQINSSMQPSITSYLVNENGDIELPMLGKIHVAGLTTAAAKDSIRNRALVHLNDPTITIRFANFKINVIGEVAKPGTYVVPNERITLLDALSLAGDITIFGRKENVKLIRNVGDSSKVITLNLNETATMQSPYFYMQQNDIVYVEPGKTKLANLDGTKTRNLAIAASVLSVIIVLASRIN